MRVRQIRRSAKLGIDPLTMAAILSIIDKKTDKKESETTKIIPVAQKSCVTQIILGFLGGAILTALIMKK